MHYRSATLSLFATFATLVGIAILARPVHAVNVPAGGVANVQEISTYLTTSNATGFPWSGSTFVTSTSQPVKYVDQYGFAFAPGTVLGTGNIWEYVYVEPSGTYDFWYYFTYTATPPAPNPMWQALYPGLTTSPQTLGFLNLSGYDNFSTDVYWTSSSPFYTYAAPLICDRTSTPSFSYLHPFDFEYSSFVDGDYWSSGWPGGDFQSGASSPWIVIRTNANGYTTGGTLTYGLTSDYVDTINDSYGYMMGTISNLYVPVEHYRVILPTGPVEPVAGV